MSLPDDEMGSRPMTRSEHPPPDMEDQSLVVIDRDQIEELARKFHEKAAGDEGDDDDEDEGLELEEFVEAFGNVLGDNLSEKELQHMFMKIDANADGSVDWNEFTNFMLMENKGSAETDDENLKFVKMRYCELAEVPRQHQHKEMIDCILFLEKTEREKNDRLVTASRDGTIRFWSASNFAHLKTVHISQSWINGIAYMPNSNTIVACSMDRVVSFYDPYSYECISRIRDTGTQRYLPFAPIAVDAAVLHDKDEVLMLGDDGGNLMVYRMKGKDWHICDGRPGLPCKHSLEGKPSLHSQNVQLSRLLNLHDDWITKVKYDSQLGLVITASLDCTIKQIDINKIHTAQPIKRTFEGHSKGVYSFDYSKKFKFMVSCGLERKIILWDPFTCKVVNTLVGHTSSVQDVVVNDDANLLISLSIDKVIKFWDVRNYKCIQTIVDPVQHRPENRISAMLYDGSQDRLLTATSSLHCYLGKRESAQAGPRSHKMPLTAALYNQNFNQVVSADIGGGVHVWDVDTGVSVFHFQTQSKITAMCYDYYKRRLVTGGHDGQLEIWNFSNGQQLVEFANGGDDDEEASKSGRNRRTEISAVQYTQENKAHSKAKYAISVGWDRKVSVWQEAQGKMPDMLLFSMPKSKHDPNHTDDILCVCTCGGNTLATGGYDGAIVLWHFDSRNSHLKMWPSPTYESQMSPNMRAVEQVSWLPKKNVLVSCGSDGYLRFWNINTGKLFMQKYAHHKRGEAILSLVVDQEEEYIFTGDAAGFLKVWDISNFLMAGLSEHTPPNPSLVIEKYHWRAHIQALVSLDFIQDKKIIISSSSDCTVLMWDLAGGLIGMYGQHTKWDLDDQSTWARPSAQLLPPIFDKNDANPYKIVGMERKSRKSQPQQDQGESQAQSENHAEVKMSDEVIDAAEDVSPDKAAAAAVSTDPEKPVVPRIGKSGRRLSSLLAHVPGAEIQGPPVPLTPGGIDFNLLSPDSSSRVTPTSLSSPGQRVSQPQWSSSSLRRVGALNNTKLKNKHQLEWYPIEDVPYDSKVGEDDGVVEHYDKGVTRDTTKRSS